LWSVSKIAERDGVSKQAVSKNVRRLLERGLVVERNTRGEISGVDVTGYFRLLGRNFDFSELQGDTAARHSIYAASEALALIIDRLPLHARGMAEAVEKDGEAGAAVLLKALAFDLRREVTEAWRRHLTPAYSPTGGGRNAGTTRAEGDARQKGVG
jgi:DNA-binding transcriptional ArsR family regulator